MNKRRRLLTMLINCVNLVEGKDEIDADELDWYGTLPTTVAENNQIVISDKTDESDSKWMWIAGLSIFGSGTKYSCIT